MWHQFEATGVYRHDRPVFGAHRVVGAKRVPDHDVGVDKLPVRLLEGGQASAAGVLIRVVAAGVPLSVYVLYSTAWVEADGSVHFRQDLYERDKVLGKRLGSVPHFP